MNISFAHLWLGFDYLVPTNCKEWTRNMVLGLAATPQ